MKSPSPVRGVVGRGKSAHFIRPISAECSGQSSPLSIGGKE